MDKRKDAQGVNCAHKLLADGYDLLATIDIRPVCVAVINRYDKTKKGAETTCIAVGILKYMSTNSFVFRVSGVKTLCEYLIAGE